MRAHARATLLACLLLLLAAVAAHAAFPPPPAERGPAGNRYTTSQRCELGSFTGRRFVMLNAPDVALGDNAYRDCTLRRFADLHVGIVREKLLWGAVERRRGHDDWRFYDEYIATLARNGITMLPMILGTPRFRSSAPAHPKRGVYPPRHVGDMARFTRRAVLRYGPGGAFWKARPDVPYLPVRAWQVWNEPNLRVFWPAGPDPAAYRRLLNAVGDAIHAADPGATVVSAGLPYSRLGKNPVQFLAAMERDGRARFDAFAVHAYARTPEDAVAILRRVRTRLDRTGHRRARLWVTEVGWPDAGPRAPVPIGARYEADAIERLYGLAWAARTSLRLDVVGLWSYRDLPPDPGGSDSWGLHLGLVTRKGHPKPAYAAFARAAARIADAG